MTTRITADNITDGTIQTADLSANVTAAYATGLVPKITTVNVANSTYAVLDDTAVNIGGGYLVITGKNFESGAQVLVDITPATSTTFVNTTTLRAEVPTKSAATYNLYVVNPDGGTGTKVNGLTYSGVPTWVTGSTLANVISNTAFTGSLSATGATSYANTTALPSGFTLVTANGYYYGNISVGSDTTYNFTIRATDAENQDSDRAFSLTASVVLLAPTSVEYLVVAGGGGGGFGAAGGGGAGGYRTGTLSVSAGTPYTVTVGSGGSFSPATGTRASPGGSSVFSSITSAGGGGGGSFWPGPTAPAPNPNSVGGSGGSGGGSAGANFPPSTPAGGSGNTPSVSPSQGNNGGSGYYVSGTATGGGGGGAAAAGQDAGTSGGSGGSGSSSPISGSSVTYAGGGGGGSHNGSPSPKAGGTGGSGGGGAGGAGNPGSGVGANGSTNTGGGAGGGAFDGSSNQRGGTGGSGIVIVRYADSSANAVSTTGSPTFTLSGGYRIYTFTGSGSITF